jgi:hypothetical protein
MLFFLDLYLKEKEFCLNSKFYKNCFKVHIIKVLKLIKSFHAGCQWLTPVILAAQEAEIRRIMVQTQPGQIFHDNPSQKRVGAVARSVGPEFKPQYHKKRRKMLSWL